MGRDTGIPKGKNPRCPPPKKKGRQRETAGGIKLWEVEGTHSSLGKNSLTTLNNKLLIIMGRHNQIERNEFYCMECNDGSIGDEFHVVRQ